MADRLSYSLTQFQKFFLICTNQREEGRRHVHRDTWRSVAGLLDDAGKEGRQPDSFCGFYPVSSKRRQVSGI